MYSHTTERILEGTGNLFSKARVPVKNLIMKKILLVAGIVFLVSVLSHVHAQSIDNKNWKAYLDAPINDTVTFHMRSDSSFVTSSNGNVVIRIHCAIIGDTLTIVNQDADEHGCPEQKGKYMITLKDDSLILTVIEDACEGRAHALSGVKWRPTINNTK